MVDRNRQLCLLAVNPLVTQAYPSFPVLFPWFQQSEPSMHLQESILTGSLSLIKLRDLRPCKDDRFPLPHFAAQRGGPKAWGGGGTCPGNLSAEKPDLPAHRCKVAGAFSFHPSHLTDRPKEANNRTLSDQLPRDVLGILPVRKASGQPSLEGLSLEGPELMSAHFYINCS